MFGGLMFLLNDKMACGVINDDLMVRVGPAAYDESLAHEHRGG
jgi:TfoX/Sxy family transcriptional regulator of competence genes